MRSRATGTPILVIVTLLVTAPRTPAAPGYGVAVADTMVRVRIDEPFTGEPRKAGALTVRPHAGSLPKPPVEIKHPQAGELRREARLSAAPGESEGFQLVISATDADLTDIFLSATPLKLTGGDASIPPERIGFRQLGYVKTSKPAYGVERVGWFADPLLNPTRFGVRKGDVQPVWVTIRVPPGTPPGRYTGTVTVKPKDAEATTVPVALRVWGFEIPEKGSHLKTAFSWDEAGSAAIHGEADWKDKGLKRRYVDCLLEHRMGVDQIYRSTPPSVEDVKYAVQNGAGNFNLFNVGWPAKFTDEQVAAKLKQIEAVWKQYQDAGVADKAYVYGFDEHYQEVAIPQIYGAIGKAFPGLKRAVSTGPRGKPADDHVDIWTMSLGTYFAAMQAGHVERLQPKGVQFWLYLSTSAGPPRPNWWIESPLIESRSLFWLAYQVDADGCLYYFSHGMDTTSMRELTLGGDVVWAKTLQYMGGITRLRLSPDGVHLVAINDRECLLFDRATRTLRARFAHERPAEPAGLDCSPDGRWFVYSAHARLHVVNTSTARCVTPAVQEGKAIREVALTTDGRHLLTVDRSPDLTEWDTRTWQLVRRYAWKIGPLVSVAVSPDGCRAAVGSNSGVVLLWDLEG